MQTLVALYNADGHILSRNDLVQLCWGGAIVGDNAIQRAVSQARKLAATVGEASFEIEAIRGVGYRLVIPDRGAPASRDCDAHKNAPPEPTGKQAPSRWTTAIALVTLSLVLGVPLFLSVTWANPNRPAALAVMAAGPNADNPESSSWAQHLSADLARLSRAGRGFSDLVEIRQTGDASESSTYLVQISTARSGNERLVDTRIVAADDGSILWSGNFTGTPDGFGAMRERLAVRVAYLLQCLLRGAQKGVNRSVAELYTRACEIAYDQPGMVRVSLLRRVMKESPRYDEGWAELSIAEANAAEFRTNTFGRSGETEALGQSAREHLEKAKRADPAGYKTLIAEALLLELTDHWSRDRQLALYDKAISLEPEAAAPYAERAKVLFELGRLRDAIGDARRAVELDPLVLGHRSRLITLLFYQGLSQAAAAELEEAERLWPASDAIRDARLRYLLRYGEPSEALAAREKSGVPSADQPVWEAYLRARHSGKTEDIEAAVELSNRMYERRPGWAAQHLQLLAHLNRVDEAYDVISRARSLGANFTRDPSILFREYTAPLRQDPRFIQLAAKAGLIRSWQLSGRWPDFCSAADLPYDCHEVASALQTRS